MTRARTGDPKSPAQPVIPWQDAATDADRKQLMKAAGITTGRRETPVLPPVLRRIGAGPRGRFPGRVASRPGWHRTPNPPGRSAACTRGSPAARCRSPAH